MDIGFSTDEHAKNIEHSEDQEEHLCQGFRLASSRTRVGPVPEDEAQANHDERQDAEIYDGVVGNHSKTLRVTKSVGAWIIHCRVITSNVSRTPRQPGFKHHSLVAGTRSLNQFAQPPR